VMAYAGHSLAPAPSCKSGTALAISALARQHKAAALMDFVAGQVCPRMLPQRCLLSLYPPQATTLKLALLVTFSNLAFWLDTWPAFRAYIRGDHASANAPHGSTPTG
jgi:hypothetical protein